MDDATDIDGVATSPRWPRYPYPGLRPFQVGADADESLIFYGRDAHKDEIIGRLGRAHLVMVIGPSGCGKSSLIKAGVIPALEAGFLARAGERWRTQQVRPGRRPLAELARAFARVAVTTDGPDRSLATEEFEGLLCSGPSGLWLVMGRLRELGALGTDGHGRERLVILLDQFEELFGPQIENKPDVDDFVRLLVRFFEKPHEDLYLVVTMRTGYIGDAVNFVGLAELLNATMYLTPVLGSDELREAIALPAQDYEGAVEPALIEALLADMGTGTRYDADNLPLLQHALLWLWLQAVPEGTAPVPTGEDETVGQPVRLTLADYERSGKLWGILDRHAEQVLADAVIRDPKRLGTVAELVFRRLTERDHGARYRRSPTTMAELDQLAGCGQGELAQLLGPFADASASLIELRPPVAAPDTMVDISHESLIRQWPRLRGWADAEAVLRERFARLREQAEEWSASGRRFNSVLRGNNLATAVAWHNATDPYRAHPGALEAWANRRTATGDATWSEPYGGPAQAVDALYAASTRARWAWRCACALAAAICLVVGGYILKTTARVAEEKLLTQLADLYAVAMANRDLPIGIMPEERRAAVYQELAVLMGAVDESLTRASTDEQRERLRVVESEIDRVARQTLARTIEPEPMADRGAGAAWQEVVRECVQRAEAGARRQVLSVQAMASDAPLGVMLGVDGSRDSAFAMLTQLDHRATLETIHFGTATFGHSFDAERVHTCQISRDRAHLDVSSAADVALAPTARWLVERPNGASGVGGAATRVRRLDWFQICIRPDPTGGCAPLGRQWHAEPKVLGDYLEFGKAGQFPATPAAMPALMPRYERAEAAAALGPLLARPSDPSGRLHTTAPERFDEQQTWGDALMWGDSVMLSSEATPGFLISAYASSSDLVAFVASAGAPTAQLPADTAGPRPCQGRELCTHVVRIVRLGDPNRPIPGLSRIPIVDLQFVGPPIQKIAFGDATRPGELLFRFAAVGSVATLTWDRKQLKDWICRNRALSSPAAADGVFTPAFMNFKKAAFEDRQTTQEILETACGGP